MNSDRQERAQGLLKRPVRSSQEPGNPKRRPIFDSEQPQGGDSRVCSSGEHSPYGICVCARVGLASKFGPASRETSYLANNCQDNTPFPGFHGSPAASTGRNEDNYSALW